MSAAVSPLHQAESFAPARPGREQGLSAYAGLAAKSGILHALAWQVIGLAALAVHVLLIRELGILFFPVVPTLLAVLYAFLPLAGLIVFLQILLYQNWVVSALLDDNVSTSAFQVMQATGFVAVGVLAAVALYRILCIDRGRFPLARRLSWMTCAAIVVALAYTVLGAAAASPTSAATYFRNSSAMLLALLIGLDVGRVWGYETVGRAFLVTAVLGFALTLLEIANPLYFYDTFHVPAFMTFKYGASKGAASMVFRTGQDVLNYHRAALFNVTGGTQSGLSSVRYGGPNMHAISYAYVLSVTAIVALSLRQWWLLLLFFPLLVILGTKGAVILLVVACGLQFVWLYTRNRRLLLWAGALFCLLYVGLGIPYGLRHGDFHAIGFMGGVHGFLRKPWGHGIGVGGNLSTLAATGLNAAGWQKFQHAGAADFATESAVGVLIYQMGIGSLALLGLFVAILRAAPLGAAWEKVRPKLPPGLLPSHDIIFIGFGTVLVNGVFQEEAYSPYALGLLAILVGVAVINGRRPLVLGGGGAEAPAWSLSPQTNAAS